MDQDKMPENIIISQIGAIGQITLNRPKALNALSLDMIRDIRFALDRWKNDNSVKAVYINANGERAFCAGGDIKHFYRVGMDYRKGDISFDVAMLFFQEEYDLNQIIFSYPKPIISHMHGITMGGGYGIAGNAKYRLVAENTIFAMPETKIGFFPDIGSMYHLTRVPDNLGLFLAMSGSSIKAGDMLAMGLAEYACELNAQSTLFDALNSNFKANYDAHKVVQDVLSAQCSTKSNARLYDDEALCELSDIFGADSAQEIVEKLITQGKFSKLSDEISRNSPFSVYFAKAYYDCCAGKPFDEVIQSDFRVCSGFAQGSEFYEGIRAAVIDKDKSPAWLNASVHDVSQEEILNYLTEDLVQ